MKNTIDWSEWGGERIATSIKPLSSYNCCAIIEGFSGIEHTPDEILGAWAYLIKTGACWSLQGFYGRNAQHLIEAEIISDCGDIL